MAEYFFLGALHFRLLWLTGHWVAKISDDTQWLLHDENHPNPKPETVG